MSRRLVKIPKAAEYIGVTPRSVRNYLGQGHFPGYKVPGVAGVLVDLDDVDAALALLPPRTVRPAYGHYGPKAKIIALPPQPVRVEAVPVTDLASS